MAGNWKVSGNCWKLQLESDTWSDEKGELFHWPGKMVINATCSLSFHHIGPDPDPDPGAGPGPGPNGSPLPPIQAQGQVLSCYLFHGQQFVRSGIIIPIPKRWELSIVRLGSFRKSHSKQMGYLGLSLADAKTHACYSEVPASQELTDYLFSRAWLSWVWNISLTSELPISSSVLILGYAFLFLYQINLFLQLPHMHFFFF